MSRLSRRARWIAIVVHALALFVGSGRADAHELGVAVLELREPAAGRYEASLRVPGRPMTEVPTLRLPERCTDDAAPHVERTIESTRILRRFRCAPALAARDALVVDNLTSGVFVKLALVGVPARTRLEEAGAGVKRILVGAGVGAGVATPSARGFSFLSYAALGFEHILLGLDHVLFVLGLTLLARGRHLVWLVSGFTLGHSITLALATLGLASVPAAPVEACIALTLVLLAREVLARESADAAPPLRAHAAMCAVFGLLHGLGFAGALGEVALRGDALLAALAAFNLGVEAGQLAVIAAALVVAAAWRRLAPLPAFSFTNLAARALGVFAFAWTLARVSTFWSAGA